MLNMNKSLRLKAAEEHTFWEEQKIRKGIKKK
jgi:hypothetical protein